MPIVTPAEVAKMLRRTFTPDDSDVAKLVIGGLQGELEAHTGKRYQVVSYTETHPLAYGAFSIVLRNRPVTALTSLTLDGVASTTDGIIVRPWGLQGSYSGSVPYPSRAVSAAFTYTAGIDGSTDPQARGAVLGAASRIMAAVLADNVGMRALSVDGGTRFDFVAGGEHGFTEAELSKFKPRRKVGVA